MNKESVSQCLLGSERVSSAALAAIEIEPQREYVRKESLKKLDIWIRDVTAIAHNKAYCLDQPADILSFKEMCISLKGDDNEPVMKDHNIDSSFQSLIRRE